MHALSVLLCLPVLLLAPPSGTLEEIIATYPDGTVKARYTIDLEGRLNGSYVEYYENGKLYLKARYKKDLLDGRYETFYENGRRDVICNYKAGDLHGKYEERRYEGDVRVIGKYKKGDRDGKFEYFDEGRRVSKQSWNVGNLLLLEGVAPHPVALEEIWATLERIYDPERTPIVVAGEKSDSMLDEDSDISEAQKDAQRADRVAALRRLMGYRFLSGLAWSDMQLDAKYNYYATMAARLLVVIGHLDHGPENPGLPREEYKAGYRGTSSSNLAGGSSLLGSINAYMNDSDAKNIKGVGHRNWCLNPKMLRTGFGIRENFSAMWSFDGARNAVPRWLTVPYPAPGWYPAEYFSHRHAWSVRLNPGSFARPKAEEVQVAIWQLDDEYVRMGDPFELDHLGIKGHLLIFRPAQINVRIGNRFWVEISGLNGPKDLDTLRYLVEFSESRSQEQ